MSTGTIRILPSSEKRVRYLYLGVVERTASHSDRDRVLTVIHGSLNEVDGFLPLSKTRECHGQRRNGSATASNIMMVRA